MVDVHSHILPFVDDGSDSVEKSLQLVKKLTEQGATKIFLTPHFKTGRYEKSVEEIKERFNEFNKIVKENDYDVELLLGQEIYCNKEIFELLKEGKVLTLNNTKYILIEFDYFNYTDISDYVYNLMAFGYTPIIAHVERYTYLEADTLIDLKNQGALIQVNASSIASKKHKVLQKKVFAAMNLNLVDFVATDIHAERECYFEKAYQVVKRKYGLKTANRLFIENANLLNN